MFDASGLILFESEAVLYEYESLQNYINSYPGTPRGEYRLTKKKKSLILLVITFTS